MASRFTWLDNDAEQNQRMSVLVDLFKDKSSVDELGVGTIRDTFANALFPGTSVLHSRARYLLFIPWLLRDVARHGWASDRAQKEFRQREVRLIYALLAGGEAGNGIIGEQARDKLKRMPSAAYWAALGRYGLRTNETSVAGFFRRAAQSVRAGRAYAEDEGIAGALGVDLDLGAMPDDLLSNATFLLTDDEAAYLRDKITIRTAASLLADLVRADDTEDARDTAYIWDHPAVESFEPRHRRLIDHGRRFAYLQQGAMLLYNLRLAQLTNAEAYADEYGDKLDDWSEGVGTDECLGGWDFDDFWACVRSENPAIKLPTRTFVTKWCDVAAKGKPKEQAAVSLVADRELQLKGPRSRLHNPSARNDWSGESGLADMTYRWEVARRYLVDLTATEEVDDAVA